MKMLIKKALVVIVTTLVMNETEAQNYNNYNGDFASNNNTYTNGYTNTSYTQGGTYASATVTYTNGVNNGWGYADNGWNDNFYGGYYNDFLYMKHFTKRVLLNNAGIIMMARNNACFDPMNTSLVIKAIRHQRFAKHLYRQGFFNEAINHSNFARSLAVQAISFYQPGFIDPYYGYMDNYMDPYYGGGYDAYDGYYEGYGYKKGQKGSAPDNGKMDKKGRPTPGGQGKAGNAKVQKPLNIKKIDNADLEKQLPKENMKDEQLLKIKDSDLKIEE